MLNLLIDLLLREIRTIRFECEDEDIPPPPVCNHSIACNTETVDVVHVCDILSNYPMSDASALLLATVTHLQTTQKEKKEPDNSDATLGEAGLGPDRLHPVGKIQGL